MKRSEMVRLIANYLSDYQNWGNELEEASDLLLMIERKGMLPPILTEYANSHIEINPHTGNSMQIEDYHQWEEE